MGEHTQTQLRKCKNTKIQKHRLCFVLLKKHKRKTTKHRQTQTNYQTNYQVDTPTNNYFISRKEESNNFMWYYRQYSASSIER